MEVILNIKDSRKAPFLMELLKSLDYIHIKKVEKKSDNLFLANLADAFEEVKLHEQGKIKLKS